MSLNAPFTLPAILKRFATRQSPEEIARQYAIARETATKRRVLAVVAFATAIPFLPVWVCATLWALDAGFDVLSGKLLRNLDPGLQPNRYLAMLAVAAAAQATYCLIPVLCWQLSDPMAKAYAVGAITITLVGLTTLRTVHLPLALLGAGTVTLAATLGNGWYWLQLGNLAGLAVSTICIAAAAWFALMTILSVHRTHAEMRRERAAAQAADQAKSRFLAQMSHELRTPLNAILGMGRAELALAHSDEGRARLSILVQSARGLAVMLNDILDLSAAQAGQLPIRPRALDLRAEIASTVAMFLRQVEDAGLVLRFSVHDSVPHYARVDGQRLRQCLSNILSNAVKHTARGMISVDAYEDQPGLLAIKVTDSGPGVPEALHEKIFEPYFRGQLTVPGTGLGMSIGRTLARRMGGDLVLLPSVPGAHFLLTLAVEPAQLADLQPPEPPAGASLAGVQVLVVDDIATNRIVAATYLHHLGATTIEATSGAEALARIGGPTPPDMVLLDLLMPDMDGHETLRRIRALGGSGANIPVIAMSADATEHRENSVPKAGAFKHGDPKHGASKADTTAARFDGYVMKPLTSEGLGVVLLSLAGQIAAPGAAIGIDQTAQQSADPVPDNT